MCKTQCKAWFDYIRKAVAVVGHPRSEHVVLNFRKFSLRDISGYRSEILDRVWQIWHRIGDAHRAVAEHAYKEFHQNHNCVLICVHTSCVSVM